MQKKSVLYSIICSVILALVLNIFFGRVLSAKISTLPVLNKWNLISPQTPIVINNRETIRVSDSGDLLQAVNAAKPRLSAVVMVKDTEVTQVGTAANITSDGLFVTASSTFASPGQNYSVQLPDGTVGAVSQLISDNATGLVFFKANLNSVPTTVFGSSQDLMSGEKILFLAATMENFQIRFAGSFVTRGQHDVQSVKYDADKPSRSFGVQSANFLEAGETLVNLKGELIGIWNGSAIISSDVLRQSVNLLLADGSKISRPVYGFTYTYTTDAEQKILDVPAGVRVLSVVKQKVPSLLEENDLITAINGSSVNEENPMEVQLAKYKTGESVTFTLIRAKIQTQVTVKAQ